MFRNILKDAKMTTKIHSKKLNQTANSTKKGKSIKRWINLNNKCKFR